LFVALQKEIPNVCEVRNLRHSQSENPEQLLKRA